MAIKGYAIEPNYATPPGATLKEVLAEKMMTQTDLAQRVGLTTKTISKIVNGTAPLSPETASNLEIVLGVPASFWNNLEISFRANLEEKRKQEEISKQIEFIKCSPYNEMAKVGLVEKTKDNMEKVSNLLRFFGCATVDILQNQINDNKVLAGAYRGSATAEVDKLALYAWIRKGELLANQIDTEEFDKVKAKAQVSELRSLTNEINPSVFIPKLQEICASFGVAVVFVPEVKGSRVCGLTRWLTPHPKAIIQLSLRYKTNDSLWFTFFHELGHIIKHSKQPFYTFKKGYVESSMEIEANAFASNTLIPAVEYETFIEKGIFSRESIVEFARDISIHPGIVVGRLQNDKHLEWRNLTDLKSRYSWEFSE
ncbi:helix-turn-helix domain-containing protein [Vagococcus salmoninarum]|uniref:helix-turn-helix domain-containing protein n=1 Tax=Vagococcus salmoninarum TaxID=2739 RepID=UPI00187E34E0|nr:helix-turn-helix domain-containing protein [Vagococcus salmoninarum]MBE9388188.1 helix-turn-helix domain-containing protein [Vagococcus salmoninarum]